MALQVIARRHLTTVGKWDSRQEQHLQARCMFKQQLETGVLHLLALAGPYDLKVSE